MNKIIFVLLINILFLSAYSQTTTNALRVIDTRNINDLPNFNSTSIRADFKFRSTIGVPGSDTFSTNITISPWSDATGGLHHQLSFNSGGIYYRTGGFNNATWNVWQKILLTDANGNIQGNLSIAGTVLAREVRVEITAGADHVFHDSYALRPLSEVEAFVKENKHLPEVQSEKQMQEDGLSINAFQIKLLQKIEELTLYVIDLKKENQQQGKLIQDLQSQLPTSKQ